MLKVIIVSSLLFSPIVLAHPGNTDRNGCHTDRKIGYYHCHTTKDEYGRKIKSNKKKEVKDEGSVQTVLPEKDGRDNREDVKGNSRKGS